MIQILQSLKDLNYGKYGIFLILGNAGFISSTVSSTVVYCTYHNGLGLREV